MTWRSLHGARQRCPPRKKASPKCKQPTSFAGATHQPRLTLAIISPPFSSPPSIRSKPSNFFPQRLRGPGFHPSRDPPTKLGIPGIPLEEVEDQWPTGWGPKPFFVCVFFFFSSFFFLVLRLFFFLLVFSFFFFSSFFLSCFFSSFFFSSFFFFLYSFFFLSFFFSSFFFFLFSSFLCFFFLSLSFSFSLFSFCPCFPLVLFFVPSFVLCFSFLFVTLVVVVFINLVFFLLRFSFFVVSCCVLLFYSLFFFVLLFLFIFFLSVWFLLFIILSLLVLSFLSSCFLSSVHRVSQLRVSAKITPDDDSKICYQPPPGKLRQFFPGILRLALSPKNLHHLKQCSSFQMPRLLTWVEFLKRLTKVIPPFLPSKEGSQRAPFSRVFVGAAGANACIWQQRAFCCLQQAVLLIPKTYV